MLNTWNSLTMVDKLRAATGELGGTDEDLLRGFSDKQRCLEAARVLVGKAGSGAGAVRTLADMFAAGKYVWVQPLIIEENFPVNHALFMTEGCKVFHFNKLMKTGDVEAAIRGEGYEPDGIEKLLAYSAEHPEERGRYRIVGLGSSWVRPADRGRFIPFFHDGTGGRCVSLGWVDDDSKNLWDEDCQFLASPQAQR